MTLEVAGSGSLRLQLFGTSRRFYEVTLSPAELAVGRVERGVPAARRVVRLCRSAPPAGGQAAASGTVRLFLLGYGSGERPEPVGSGCMDSDAQGLGVKTEVLSGQQEEAEGSAGWEVDGSAMGESYSHEPVTVGPLPLMESADGEAEEMTAMHELTAMVVYPAPAELDRAADESAAAAREMAPPAELSSSEPPELEDRSIISWPDGLAFYLIGQIPDGDAQAVWTSDCSATSGM